jgi:uncharacterized membrane protein
LFVVRYRPTAPRRIAVTLAAREVRVRLLLLLLIAGAIAWFAPAPISRASNAVVIDASRDRVWGVVSDMTSARLWDPGMKEVKLVGDAKSGEGTVRASDGLLGRTIERVRESLSFNRLRLDVTHDPKLTKFETSTIDLEPSGNGTRVEWTLEYQMNGGYVGVLADKLLLGPVHQGRIDQGLANLRRYAETGEPANF